MSKNYYLPDFYTLEPGFNAANKSKNDLLTIYKEMDITPFNDLTLTLENKRQNNPRTNSRLLNGYVDSIVKDIGTRCEKGDAIFMDYPFAVKFSGYRRIILKAKQTGVKIIFIIHGLGGAKGPDLLYRYADEVVLNYAHCLISASKEMTKKLRDDFQVDDRIKSVTYNYWDYLCNDIENDNRNALLCYAGDLSSASFLSKLPESVSRSGVNLYGHGMSAGYKGIYKGEFDPEELVSVMDGKYGLIWDGKKPDNCDDMFGNSMRINVSHKFSLYMAAKKPVIVWKDSALSNFVTSKKLGFTIDSLEEIPYLLSRTNLYEYEEMVQNVSEIRKGIISGDHFKSVIRNSLT